jgi:hypothetical protein
MRTRLISVSAERLSPVEVANSDRDIDPFSSNASIMFTYEEVATATGRPPSPSAEREAPWALASRFPFCRPVTMQENTSMSWMHRQVCPQLPLRSLGAYPYTAGIRLPLSPELVNGQIWRRLWADSLVLLRATGPLLAGMGAE